MTPNEEKALAVTQRLKGGIDPGKGYRLLEVGEIIKSGDEFKYAETWHLSVDEGFENRGGMIRRRKLPD